jgi:hypothetical protein
VTKLNPLLESAVHKASQAKDAMQPLMSNLMQKAKEQLPSSSTVQKQFTSFKEQMQ